MMRLGKSKVLNDLRANNDKTTHFGENNCVSSIVDFLKATNEVSDVSVHVFGSVHIIIYNFISNISLQLVSRYFFITIDGRETSS